LGQTFRVLLPRVKAELMGEALANRSIGHIGYLRRVVRRSCATWPPACTRSRGRVGFHWAVRLEP
jgi:hypothetical protein